MEPKRADENAAAAGDQAARERFLADIAELRGRLEAVVNATSDAAATIISGLEQVLAAGAEGETQDRAFDALSACVFHDIVGQHVARAAELLAIIEKIGGAQGTPQPEDAAAARPRPDLVSGPATPPDPGLSQDDVDAFFL